MIDLLHGFISIWKVTWLTKLKGNIFPISNVSKFKCFGISFPQSFNMANDKLSTMDNPQDLEWQTSLNDLPMRPDERSDYLRALVDMGR
jgi:hypothetical protein